MKVTFDRNATKLRLQAANQKATFATATQALKDCNYYCKEDQEGLINSSISSSDLDNGLLIWNKPYAKMQYYLDSTSLDPNKNARKMWAHHAHSVHGEQWQAVYQAALIKEATP